MLATVYFRPDHIPFATVRISVIDDSLNEGEERFLLQLKSYDIAIVLAIDCLRAELTCSEAEHPTNEYRGVSLILALNLTFSTLTLV